MRPGGTDAGDCVASPCRTINHAVDRADSGDIVSLGPGTYREGVRVSKRVALVGHYATIGAAGQASPANGVFVHGPAAAGTLVSGFTIRNAGLEGIFVLQTSRVRIENNVLIGNDAYGPKHPRCIHHQSDCGEAIHLQSVTGSVVRGNTVRDNLGGILLTDENGPTADDTIAGNIVAHNPNDCGITLASHWLDTTATSAVAEGVAGVYRNVVVHNTVSESGGAGIGVLAAGPGAAAWGNIVSQNTSTKNFFAGLMIHAHARAQSVDGNVFSDNILEGNGTDLENPADKAPAGISLFSARVPIRGTVITGNRIRGEHYGIIALNAVGLPDASRNTFDSSVAVAMALH